MADDQTARDDPTGKARLTSGALDPLVSVRSVSPEETGAAVSLEKVRPTPSPALGRSDPVSPSRQGHNIWLAFVDTTHDLGVDESVPNTCGIFLSTFDSCCLGAAVVALTAGTSCPWCKLSRASFSVPAPGTYRHFCINFLTSLLNV